MNYKLEMETNTDYLKCNKCGKFFSTKYTLAKHTKTSKKCMNLNTVSDTDINECDYCLKTFSTKGNLVKHIQICKQKKDNTYEKVIQYEEKIKSIASELKNKNSELKLAIREIKHKDQEIAKLKEELAFQKGQFSGYTKVKPSTQIINRNITTNTQYINPRLKDVPIENIEPFVQRTIDLHLSTYTYSHYKDHRRGVVEHLLSITTFRDSNDILNKSLACTNRSMNTFYALLEDKVWTKDLAVESIHKYLDSLRPLVEMYWPKFQKEQYAAIDEGDSDKVLINSKIYAKLLSFNPGVLEQHSHGFRKELVERIQAKIRNTLSV